VQAIGEAHAALVRVAHELKVIRRLSQAAVAAASYGVDEADANARTQLIIQRMESLQKVPSPFPPRKLLLHIKVHEQMSSRTEARTEAVKWLTPAIHCRGLRGRLRNWTKWC
jgi:hypothetical protein